MPFAETVLVKIADAVFGFVVDAGKTKLNKAISGDPQKKAFARALQTALTPLEQKHGDWVN